MADSTSPVPQVIEGAGAVPMINQINDAASQSMIGGRNAETTSLLTWGYIGGRISGVVRANGTVALTASNTNYVVMKKSDLVVSASTATTNWDDSTDYWRLYSVVTNTTTVTSYADERLGNSGLFGLGAAGAGTVTSVGAAGGIETTTGVAITGAGTIRAAIVQNAQIGTNYTVLADDRFKLVTLSNASPVAVTLPEAVGTFGSGWCAFFKNAGAGTVTITPTTSTIDGGSSLVLTTGQCALVVSNGTNYISAFVASGGGATWGGIGGTLASQTDLQAALDAKAAVGVPQNSQSTAYTLVLSDANKHILHPSADTTARIITIPANSSVAFPVGTAVTFINQNAAGVMTIAITTDTMRLAGAGTTGSRTLAANGMATALKITSTEWIISGTGLT
jgi:hypothetical protein